MAENATKGISWDVEEPEEKSAIDRFMDSRRWDFNTVIAMLMAILAVSIAFFIISRCLFLMEPRLERTTIVTLMLLYVFLRFPTGKRKWTDPPGWLFAFDLFHHR